MWHKTNAYVQGERELWPAGEGNNGLDGWCSSFFTRDEGRWLYEKKRPTGPACSSRVLSRFPSSLVCRSFVIPLSVCQPIRRGGKVIRAHKKRSSFLNTAVSFFNSGTWCEDEFRRTHTPGCERRRKSRVRLTRVAQCGSVSRQQVGMLDGGVRRT